MKPVKGDGQNTDPQSMDYPKNVPDEYYLMFYIKQLMNTKWPKKHKLKPSLI